MKVERRKLLFVTDVFPFPLDRGQRVRVKNLLAACCDAFAVTFVGPAPSRDSDREAVEKDCAECVYLNPGPPDWRRKIAIAAQGARASGGLVRTWNNLRNLQMLEALQLARPRDFDLVWAERPHVARFCAAFRARTIVDLDDLEHVKMERFLKLARDARECVRLAYPYLLYRHYEVNASRGFLASVVCSDEDRRYLEKRGCRNVTVVPNGPSLRSAGAAGPPPRSRDARPPLRVAFVGNVAAEPNADAIAFLADAIMPIVRSEMPDATLDVIGPGSTDTMIARYVSRATFRGFVEDLAGALAGFDVLAAPLRFGGGTKLKILDAMTQGLPVVTTAVGAEGLALRHGENAWLAETPRDLADGLLRIKRDPELAQHLAINAYRHVESLFAWGAIRRRLSEWLVRLRPPDVAA